MLAAAVCGSVGAGHAQSTPPNDAAFAVQLFDYAIGPRTFLTVTDADVAVKEQISADVLLTVLTNPLVIYNVDPITQDVLDERSEVVRTLIAGELMAAYGLTSALQVGVGLPIVFSISGDGLDPATAMPDESGLQATGFGDLRAEVKYRFWRSGALRVAGIGTLTLPTSFGAGGSAFLGDDLPSLRGKLAGQWSNGRFSAGANIGLIVQKPRALYASEVGPQITYGGAGAVAVNKRVTGVAEIFGRTGIPGFEFDLSPLEVNSGVRLQATSALSVLFGGGAGLGSGIGAPELRVFVSVGWAPDFADDDGDGIVNQKDDCPLLAEDKDGHDDADGCPDDDNDGDLREDAVDRCPDVKEDIDGFEDTDGCPELDNDKDGLADIDDKCPNDAEDGISLGALAKDGCPGSKTDSDFDDIMDDVDQCLSKEEDVDGFEDWDGCPEADNDKDDLPDGEDKCPMCPEDKDGHEDEDGCPDLDNDQDGIPDTTDECPDQAEVINGVDDTDGCPDRGGRQLVALNGQVMRFSREVKFRRNRLRTAGRKMIAQAAVLMNNRPDVTTWLVVVASKQRRDPDAAAATGQKRANVLKAHLIMNGVASDRIETKGLAAGRDTVIIRILDVADSAGEDGAFQCPAGMAVVPREPGSPPVAAPATPAERTSEPETQPEPAIEPEPEP